MQFEWDENKNLKNILKHRIDFEDAKVIFKDPNQITEPDLDHSDKEERFLCIGMMGEIIIGIIFVRRGNIIRIISAGQREKWSEIYEKKKKV